MWHHDIDGGIVIAHPVWSYIHELLQYRMKTMKMGRKIYAKCIMMMFICSFAVLAADEGNELCAAYLINANMQSDPLNEASYLMVNDAFRE